MPLLLSSTTTTASLFLKLTSPLSLLRFSTMSSINLQSHAFAGNPIKAKTPKSNDPFSPNSALEALKSHLLGNTHDAIALNFKVLPFRKGRPLAGSQGSSPNWHLGWLSLSDCRGLLADSSVRFEGDSLVYLGSKSEEDSVYWAIDVSEDDKLVDELGKKYFSFVELRTLMVATDWSDSRAMADLAVAGHARALLEWHGTSRFCGQCGSKTIPREAGKRVQCSNELCKKRIYPRVDPVVIMLVIDKENDRALLSRQSRFVPRMWSCLAGFLEPGESLEEAVRRETWEETGIEVGEVVYHSSQPWPVGPSSMPCQLMVGFFAYAKSLEITVDKDELEDAQWHTREDVKKALTFAEYEKAQKTAAAKVEQICKGVTQSQNLSSDFNTESGELASMFIPGPFAIAHHLISTWVFQGAPVSSSDSALKEPNSSLSNLIPDAVLGLGVGMGLSFAPPSYPLNVVNDVNKYKNKPWMIRSLPPSSASLQSSSLPIKTDQNKKNKSEPQKFNSSSSASPCYSQENTVGIIGGVSVLTTLIFLEKFVLWSSRDKHDTVPFIVCSDPTSPSSCEYISNTNDGSIPSGLDQVRMVENLRGKRLFLEEGGARCIVMPCHLSHAWYGEISQGSKQPFLHMAECVAWELKEARFRPLEAGSGVKVGVIATDAILMAGVYQEKLQDQGFEVVLPDKSTMEHAIYPAINSLKRKDMKGALNLLRIAIQLLLVKSVNIVILASHELQCLLPHDDPLAKKCIDPMDALARSAVRWAKAARDTRGI